VVLLTKIDLIPGNELFEIIETVKNRVGPVPLFTISNLTNIGIDALKLFMIPKKTYCLLGLSGVGKSTLINNLSDKPLMKTKAISESTNKGVHTTSHRQLFLLDNGSIVIDNPGMREVGFTEASGGLHATFDKITELSQDCRFRDCTHSHEIDCAVLNAVEKGIIDKTSIDNYNKIRREQIHYQSSTYDKKKRAKALGKMIKNYTKAKNIRKKK